MNIEQIIRQYIDATLHMSLATVSGNRPWVSEVHFVYDADLNLYWRSLASRRHSIELATNPYVAGDIVKQHGLDESPHGIYFEGQAAVMEDIEAIQSIYPLFQARFSSPISIIDDARAIDGHKFYKLTVTKWYAFGKFGGDKSQKYELDWSDKG